VNATLKSRIVPDTTDIESCTQKASHPYRRIAPAARASAARAGSLRRPGAPGSDPPNEEGE
jgi:hypothetical protein